VTMNVTPHPDIPGLYNVWDEGVFSSIRALNMGGEHGRVWRTYAYHHTETYRSDGGEAGAFLGDFPTLEDAVQAVEEWSKS
jgi:hypothetical protein